jgi:hypothetical protein
MVMVMVMGGSGGGGGGGGGGGWWVLVHSHRDNFVLPLSPRPCEPNLTRTNIH